MDKKRKRVTRVGPLVFIACAYLFLYVPIIVLLVFSFNEGQFPAPWTKPTLHWYRELFTSAYLWKAFGNSLFVACCTTLLTLGSGIGLIFYAAQGGKIGKFLGVFYGNVIIPETILGVSLLSFFTLVNIPLGLPTLIVAHTILGLGFVIPIVYARFRELDYTLTEASLALGATQVQTFFKVIFPLLLPTIVTAGLLVFIISFDDFILSYFCAGSTAQTLPLYVLSMIRTGVSPVVNALSAVLLLLSSVLAILFFSLKIRTRIFG